MKILIVDNGTHYKQKLLNLLKDYDTNSIVMKDIDLDLLDKGFDAIVLSGAYGSHSIKYYGDKLFKSEQELIQKSPIPVIGICLGAQLIAQMYGARLSFANYGKRVKGLKQIWNIKQTPFNFFRYYGARVWASQRWRITELPDSLEAWCASNDGVEVFKHRRKQLYGLQFHPERRQGDNDGARIFYTILELALSKPKLN